MPQEVDPHEVICICGTCGTEQNSQLAEKNAFIKAGLPKPCSFCGGVCILVERRDAKGALEAIKRQRGI